MLARSSRSRCFVGLTVGGGLVLFAATACRPASPPARNTSSPTVGASASGAPRPAVIGANEGELHFLRGGTAPLLIKVDPVTTGSRRMVLGSSDLPPGDAIGLHRHLQEDEILIILRGTARVRLGGRDYPATTGGTVFIPQGTCVEITNVGTDTLTNVFIFSSPGFEQVLRAVSSLPGEKPKSLTPAERAVAFHTGHAEAGPTDC
jgi:mannose-6-phosphate isomerase-like protein (cupin superfamily)